MTSIYSHGRVTTIATIRRTHRLPRSSESQVFVGQSVKTTETLATLETAREHQILDVAEELGISPDRLDSFLVKHEGDTIEEGDMLATRRVGLRRRRVTAPLTGRILRIEGGKMLLEGVREREEIAARIPGKVVSVEPDEQIIVEATGAAIQIAWGTDGLMWGTLKLMDELPSLETKADRFNIDHRGAIVAIGSPLSEEFLQNASDIRVKGIIASSMQASMIPKLKNVEFPVGITQGFGTYPMSERILNLLKTYNGREIVMDMGKPADWRERRPEIIIPLGSSQQAPPQDEHLENIKLVKGHRVRVLQSPFLGEIGTVSNVSDEPQQLPSGIWTRGAIVEMPIGERIFVPFANLEYLG